jgi:hypothetical protein
MPVRKPDLSLLYVELGYKPLSRSWGKAEVVLGLLAAGAGLWMGGLPDVQPGRSPSTEAWRQRASASLYLAATWRWLGHAAIFISRIGSGPPSGRTRFAAHKTKVEP